MRTNRVFKFSKRSFGISDLRRDEDGVVLVMTAVFMVVAIGLWALILGIGKANVTQSELQSFADTVALAAAGELDGKTDSITRARSAAATFVSGSQTFAAGSNTLVSSTVDADSDVNLYFHTAMPASDAAAMPTATRTNDGTVAIVVEAVVKDKTVTSRLLGALRAFNGEANPSGDVLVNASAVAGYSSDACDIAPMFFCLPGAGFTADGNFGKQVHLRANGGQEAWSAGNWGFLDVDTYADLSTTCGSSDRKNCMLAADLQISKCINSAGADLDPGQSVGTADAAINVRFDRYASTMNSLKDDARFAPAPNIVSGQFVDSNGGGNDNGNGGGNDNGNGNAGCQVSQITNDPDVAALPRDACLIAGTCTNPRFGDGLWYSGRTSVVPGQPGIPGQFVNSSYYATNHRLDEPIEVTDEVTGTTTMTDDPGFLMDPLVSDRIDPQFVNTNTRYEVYLREIEAHRLRLEDEEVESSQILPGKTGDTGLSQCVTPPSDNVERRIIVAAGIRCDLYADEMNGNASGIPVEEYFRIFLTEPVADSDEKDIHGEILGSAGGDGYGGAGEGGIFRDVVQLYR